MVGVSSQHPFHIVENSPWPMAGSYGVLLTLWSLVSYFHGLSSIFLVIIGGVSVGLVMMLWWRDVMREGVFLGFHTTYVVKGMKLGFILFVLSEMMFFLSFFWAFFHSALSPVPEMGMIWPPLNINPIHPWGLPLLNTTLLLSSGGSLTWSHYTLCQLNSKQAVSPLVLTIFLGLMFTAMQAYEYWEASFAMSDSIYGKTFFMATGFHGLHVIIGSTFLVMCLIRLFNGQFSSNHHVGYECAMWYWHFVDVVWIFLFVCIYWWGGV